MEKLAKQVSGKARSAARLNTWRAFATPHGACRAGFQQRISNSGY
jgi:hypothetical protein